MELDGSAMRATSRALSLGSIILASCGCPLVVSSQRDASSVPSVETPTEPDSGPSDAATESGDAGPTDGGMATDGGAPDDAGAGRECLGTILKRGDAGLCFRAIELTANVAQAFQDSAGRPFVAKGRADRPLRMLAFSPDAGPLMYSQIVFAAGLDGGLNRVHSPWLRSVAALDALDDGTICGQTGREPGVFYTDGGIRSMGSSRGTCRFIERDYWLSDFPGEILVGRMGGPDVPLQNSFSQVGPGSLDGLDDQGCVYATRTLETDAGPARTFGLRVCLDGGVSQLAGHTSSASARLVSVASNGFAVGYVYVNGPGPQASHIATWRPNETQPDFVLPLSAGLRSAVVTASGSNGNFCGRLLDRDTPFFSGFALGFVEGSELGLPFGLECVSIQGSSSFFLQTWSGPFQIWLLKLEAL